MTPSRRRICKPLVRSSRCAVARQCLKDVRIRKYIVQGIGLLLHTEIAALCSDKVTSVLRCHTAKSLENFSWEDVIGEMKTRAPTLLSLLEWCTKTRKTRRNTKSIIGFITAILCRHRRPTASSVQRLLSVILYSGHASKRVSQLGVQ